MTHEAPPQLRDVVIAVVAILVACAIGLGVLEWRRPDLVNKSPRRHSAELSVDHAELVRQKDLLISRLDNLDFHGAVELCQGLLETVPSQRLAVRNLAVARLLALESEIVDGRPRSPEEHATALQHATQAVKQLVNADPNSPASYYLAARLALHQQDWPSFAQALDKAEELDRQNPLYPFAFYDLARDCDDGAIASKRLRKLQRAAQLAPENLAVGVELLLAHAASESPALVQSLQRLRPQIEAHAECIKLAGEGAEILPMLDGALQQATAGVPDLKSASLSVRRVAGIVALTTAMQSDARKLRPHPLEFVVHDFDEGFYLGAQVPAAPTPQPIPVKLIPAPAERQIKAGNGVRDVRLVDFDLDGRLDVALLYSRKVELYSAADGFTRWKKLAQCELPFEVRGLAVADLDRDGERSPPESMRASGCSAEDADEQCINADVDLLAYGDGGILALRNDWDPGSGARRLEPVPQDAAFAKLTGISALVITEIDNDGDLDVVIASDTGLSVWANRDDMTFVDITRRSLLPAGFKPSALVAGDVNRDARQDIVATGTDMATAGILENLGLGQLRWQPLPFASVGLGHARAVALLEADGNASWDFLTAGKQGVSLVLTSTRDARLVYRQASTLSFPEVSRIRIWDYDNDGFCDVLACGGPANAGFTVLQGKPRGRFEPVEELFEKFGGQVGAFDVDDLDADGDLDVVAEIDGRPVIFANAGGNANHWIRLAARAEPARQPRKLSRRLNTNAHGSLVEMKSGLRYQARVVDRQWTHLGLGARHVADLVRVVWTNGFVDEMRNCGGTSVVCARQEPVGSGAGLYAWNGRSFEFVTEMHGTVPLKSQSDGQVTLPWRERDVIRVPGEKLIADNGEYRLQITQEHGAAAYIDSLRLFAVDHPLASEVYASSPNESEDPNAFELHTVMQARAPHAAVDSHGTDVRPWILKEDGRYAQLFEKWLRQGVVEPHWLELDLGPLDNPRQIFLFLTGWGVPTCSSAGVDQPHNPQPPPRPGPVLSVPDAEGNWKEVIPSVDVTRGQAQTVAIDLSDAFLTDDYRVRLETNREFYWDHVFFTVNERPVEVTRTELRPSAAELSHRGFSRIVRGPVGTPVSYAYQAQSDVPKWLPMQGSFTRYGDVHELLAEPDDGLVVMGAGDEITLRFPATQKLLPAGWKRDFVLLSAGWSKDCDLNTLSGMNSEPYPFRGMSAYPIPAGTAGVQADAEHRVHQTRRQSGHSFWRRVLVHPTRLESAVSTGESARRTLLDDAAKPAIDSEPGAE